jgi:hypothetical protein
MNIAVVQGRVRDVPDQRVASDGSLLVSFDVIVEQASQTPPSRASASEAVGTQVPVTWKGSQAKVPAISQGDMVTVVGTVHRRFYRRSGATVSRTDVRARRIIRGSGVRASRAIADVVAACQQE